jgi:hypothetical protein
VHTPTAIGVDNYNLRALSAPAGFYWLHSPSDWDGNGSPDLVATLYGPSGAFERLAFLSRAGNRYEVYDSVPQRISLVRDIADWDGDGQVEMLTVWFDSFFVYGGRPPKTLIFAGRGRAAKIASQSVWLRTEAGHYEQRTPSGQLLLRLLDTCRWIGSTTIPRLLSLRQGPDSLWVFGNYQGMLFSYRGQVLTETFHTGLEEVGSYLYPVDIEGDGYEELLYLGRHKSRKLWELSLVAANPWRKIAGTYFWDETNLSPRILLRADKRLLVWLPPQVYFGRVGAGGFQWEAYGPWAWGAFTPLEGGWLLGVDTVPRVVDFIEGLLPPPVWRRVGALSPTNVLLTWEAVSGAMNYEVWRFQRGTTPVRVYIGAGLSHTDAVGAGDTCFYAIRAVGGSFGEVRRVIPGERPCLQVKALIPAMGQVVLEGNSQWWEIEPHRFQLMPSGDRPLSAVGIGGIWFLQFGDSLPSGSYILQIDTLLTDEQGRWLSAACDSLPLGVVYDANWPCLLPTAWQMVGEKEIEVTFSASVGPEAEDPVRYRVRPSGEVLSVSRLSDRTLRLQLSLSPQRAPVSVSWTWGDSLCPRAISFSPIAEHLGDWGVYPNPVKSAREVYFWGLPTQSVVSILSANGSLCTQLRTMSGEPLLRWDLRAANGRRIEPGLYLILVEYEGRQSWQKLYVEE